MDVGASADALEALATQIKGSQARAQARIDLLVNALTESQATQMAVIDALARDLSTSSVQDGAARAADNGGHKPASMPAVPRSPSRAHSFYARVAEVSAVWWREEGGTLRIA